MSSPPPWVISSLSQILGFDEQTVQEAIVPELEAQKSEVKLKSHLQDFLGPSPDAKAFIEKYIASRFPSIPTSAPAPSPGPSLKAAAPNPRRQVQSSSSTPGAQRQPQSIPENLDGAFGPNSKMYQKNKAADQDLFGRYSPNASGSSTPRHGPHQPHEPARHGGFLTVHQVTARPSSSEKKADKVWDLPKSKEVRRLEEIREKLLEVQAGNGKVTVDKSYPDCFCQARNHPLSSYTPACHHCGLILCALHPVYAPCSSCANPLLSPAQLARVLLRVQQDMDAQLAIEHAQRDAIERERQQRLIAESGGGAFPTLGGGPPRPTHVPAALPAQERRVLTVGGKGKGKGKTTLTTTTVRPVSTPSPGEPSTPPPDDIYPRPRSPPFDIVRVAKELNKVLKWRAEEDRPWGSMKDRDRLEYQELPISHFLEDHTVGRRKAAKMKKVEGKGVDGRVVPGAAA